MESKRHPKKRPTHSQSYQNNTTPTTTHVNDEQDKRIFTHENNKIKNIPPKKNIFKYWSFGTINIRSGKENDLGAKIFMVAKETAKAGLTFCCLQEVKYRNSGKKIIQLDNGEKFEFYWCGMKKKKISRCWFSDQSRPKCHNQRT